MSGIGTNSPPVEATGGSNQHMGVSSIRGDKAESIPDSKQREGYFKEESTNAQNQSHHADKLGESVAQKFEQERQ
ncbi:hypothetical protein CYLTODRAFT_451469 [Cylindrobasidium torrendii FP15055 ss-10]|uniref:Uncharacterized protein n=1 Tax=Cylindrobasidium torrendii FP15055 ss-10 TaxID=1314674 RepID=A0A0D7BJK5_9AGAR|nr:hypothetical protein CYLTODRAFT_451469 [Cylindrobasidium torrendii FP15055 ss-10]